MVRGTVKKKPAANTVYHVRRDLYAVQLRPEPGDLFPQWVIVIDRSHPSIAHLTVKPAVRNMRRERKAILKKLGIEGNYEGIGNLILGYAAKPAAEAAPRKADYIYSI